MILLGH